MATGQSTALPATGASNGSLMYDHLLSGERMPKLLPSLNAPPGNGSCEEKLGALRENAIPGSAASLETKPSCNDIASSSSEKHSFANGAPGAPRQQHSTLSASAYLSQPSTVGSRYFDSAVDGGVNNAERHSNAAMASFAYQMSSGQEAGERSYHGNPLGNGATGWSDGRGDRETAESRYRRNVPGAGVAPYFRDDQGTGFSYRNWSAGTYNAAGVGGTGLVQDREGFGVGYNGSGPGGKLPNVASGRVQGYGVPQPGEQPVGISGHLAHPAAFATGASGPPQRIGGFTAGASQAMNDGPFGGGRYPNVYGSAPYVPHVDPMQAQTIQFPRPPMDGGTFRDAEDYGGFPKAFDRSTRGPPSRGNYDYTRGSRDRRFDGSASGFGGGYGGGFRSGFNKNDSEPGANLKPVDWSTVELKPFRKNFYFLHPDVAHLTDDEIRRMLAEHEITVHGIWPLPKPICGFAQTNFPKWILNELYRANYERPYPIQTIGWPVALSGHDMIGIAQTGSGKTLAYLLPCILHVMAQEPVMPGEGPIALVLVPTRELAVQVYQEAARFTAKSRLRAICVYGGVPRSVQYGPLRRGVEICVAAPGRLLDFLERGTTKLVRVTYLVLDEADRMLDMGFEPQIRRIESQLRKDRQTLMWSATWPREVQQLAADFCAPDTVKIAVGSHDLQANDQINQVVEVCGSSERFDRMVAWLMQHIPAAGYLEPNYEQNGARGSKKVLIFCETKKGCDILRDRLHKELPRMHALAIHGGKEQKERDRILADFKSGRCCVLLATDVASRGLDIKNIDYVVNYDMPKTIVDYIHRIGRTGRAGATGIAITYFSLEDGNGLFGAGDSRLAKQLCNVMKDVGQEPPMQLLAIARMPGHGGYGGNIGRRDGGYGGRGRGGSYGDRRFPGNSRSDYFNGFGMRQGGSMARGGGFGGKMSSQSGGFQQRFRPASCAVGDQRRGGYYEGLSGTPIDGEATADSDAHVISGPGMLRKPDFPKPSDCSIQERQSYIDSAATLNDREANTGGDLKRRFGGANDGNPRSVGLTNRGQEETAHQRNGPQLSNGAVNPKMFNSQTRASRGNRGRGGRGRGGGRGGSVPTEQV